MELYFQQVLAADIFINAGAEEAAKSNYRKQGAHVSAAGLFFFSTGAGEFARMEEGSLPCLSGGELIEAL